MGRGPRCALSEGEFCSGVFCEDEEDGTGIIDEREHADIGDDMGGEGCKPAFSRDERLGICFCPSPRAADEGNIRRSHVFRTDAAGAEDLRPADQTKRPVHHRRDASVR